MEYCSGTDFSSTRDLQASTCGERAARALHAERDSCDIPSVKGKRKADVLKGWLNSCQSGIVLMGFFLEVGEGLHGLRWSHPALSTHDLSDRLNKTHPRTFMLAGLAQEGRIRSVGSPSRMASPFPDPGERTGPGKVRERERTRRGR